MTHPSSASFKALYMLHACAGGVKAIQIPGTCAAVRHKDDACCIKEPLHEANCTRNSAIKHRMRGLGGQREPCNLPGTDPSSAFSVLLSSHALAVGQCRQPSRKLKQAEHVKAQEARVRPRCLSQSHFSSPVLLSETFTATQSCPYQSCCSPSSTLLRTCPVGFPG